MADLPTYNTERWQNVEKIVLNFLLCEENMLFHMQYTETISNEAEITLKFWSDTALAMCKVRLRVRL
ncbi:uncharacterized protein PHALS_09171 [Plasmopara halstedii]|uniref:Uncharacterized protein n=1 Tax=Plasmopara halstedii TaxID=4781 RepID=A0A0P1AE48_PLAHL|nr:uncharacterized protein PHALS_09171 [Plasmopara halstedii]CEG39113.1 hypothetical protein PHALS_09171 [Plasmopara halstedii]|eukprot:XP_024575482.1 hypothetical protein PHALS_09171 [Plasmopara halstedii]